MKKKLISMTCAFALVLGLLAGMGGGLAIEANAAGEDVSNWTEQWVSYYSNDFRDASQPLKEVSMDQYWDIDADGVITRKNAVNLSSDYQDMAFLFLNTEKYEDFILELDFKHGYSGPYQDPNGAWINLSTYVGVGGTPGKSWADPEGGTLFAPVEGYVRIRGNCGAENDVDWWGNTGGRVEPYDYTQWHHMKIEVIDLCVNVSVDDVFLFTITQGEWFVPGNIYLAANHDGAAFKNVTVTGFADNTELRELVKAVKDKTEADYTAETWSVFAQALADAREVLKTENPTQEELDNAVAALQAAVDGLKAPEETQPQETDPAPATEPEGTEPGGSDPAVNEPGGSDGNGTVIVIAVVVAVLLIGGAVVIVIKKRK